MLHYVGLDVSVKSVSICVVDEDGEVLARGETSSDPDEIALFISEHSAKPERIVHESGILAIWLSRELEKRGLPIICIDARLAHKALSGRINKSDTGDAEELAHLARTGWFSRVHIRSEASERVRVLIGARERLIRMRKDLEAHVRGVLKIFGICMGPVGRADLRQGFRDQLAEAGQADPAFGLMADMFIPIHRVLCAAAEAMDGDLRLIARQSGLARRLMTVPGVGPVVALSFIATLDNAERFRRSRDVGAFLGLTPRRHQSGDMDWSGRISKCGDRDLRRLLCSAATTLITQVRKPSQLRAWAKRLQDRKGFKKAAVAASRKLAVVMMSIWRDGTIFEPERELIT
ncbi:IS110 family transposase [Leisingera thetidis]|uniref:IS110 family transposase n=1 Tax=Leisingera thetidis TaxID=2930199 RepID=UPI0021F7CF12|nr:IS110 family transposase [Leisingera thetidis]